MTLHRRLIALIPFHSVRRFFWRRLDNRRTYIVTLRLTTPQVAALCDLLAQWNWLGSAGASRWTAFYADGDGDFKPEVRVNGRRPTYTTLVDRKTLWKGDEYRIDFDVLAWAMHKEASRG